MSIPSGFRVTVARCWKLGGTVTQEGNTSASGRFSFPRSASSLHAIRSYDTLFVDRFVRRNFEDLIILEARSNPSILYPSPPPLHSTISDRGGERKREPQHPEKSNNICPGKVEGGSSNRKRLVPRGGSRIVDGERR